MSLILEALRKSEAERRRAQVPDLLAEPALAAPIARTPTQRWPWIAAALAIAAMLAWLAMRDRSPAPITVVPKTDVAVVQQPPTAPVPQPDTQRPAPALRRPIVVAPPSPPKPETIAKAPASDIPPVLTPPARIERPAPPPPAPAPIDTTESVSDLRVDERKQLPPLKLSMHMWNDVAAQRFVIIDGTRLRVGDRLGALVISDIQPDGVLLDWNGRALKLPLR